VVGGNLLTNGPLAYLLRNRVYLGEINHRDQSYPGEHEPILDPDLFESVQAKLSENRRGLRQRRQSSNALLLGKLFDDRGNSMTPSYAIKKGVRYRYYVSCVLAQGRKEEAGSVARVAADAVERIVLDAVRDRGPDPDTAAATIAARIGKATLGALSIELQLIDDGDRPPEKIAIPWSPEPFRRKRAVIAPANDGAHGSRPIRAEARTKLLAAIARARRWLEDLISGRAASIETIAVREGVSERSARIALSFAFLAPAIVQATLDATLPRGFDVSRLTDMPASWAEQRKLLGLAAPRFCEQRNPSSV
ncbi:MAG TPA: recombinase family protein, partial [Rhizomicrobium sp.]|nr:recombinase family protein [Rhizomicrobium sp.]